MYQIRVDVGKNRLYVTFSGFIQVEEAKKSVDEAIQATEKLRRGYDVITDVSQLKPSPPEVIAEIGRIQAHFIASGVRRGVRVVGEAALTGMQFSRTGKKINYNSNNVATLEEAEKVLEAP